ncbi:MAG: copper homeostasis protein CutC [Caldilinea sp.]
MSVLLEIIATSAEDCAVIERTGGDRIELCSALSLGGLTPSAALVQRAKAVTRLPIMMMLRPREGGFCYSPEEFRQMALDLKFGLAVGVDGFVFGCLHQDGTVDARRTAHLVKLAAGRQTVFHRAFDVTPDPFAALETLIELGVTRVLTSGQQPTALAGADLIRQLVGQAAGRIEILPGAGVRADHAAELVQRTKAQQVHASASRTDIDLSTQANLALGFGGAPAAQGEGHRVVDAAEVAAMKHALASLA